MLLRNVDLLFFPISLLVLFLSCKGGSANETELWQGNRDRIEDVKILPLNAELPPMHGNTQLKLLGDTLIFHDFLSVDFQFTAFDLDSNKVIGSFGKFGNGPGEIANFGAVCIDERNRILYGMNGNQWHIAGFNLDSALNNPDYPAFVKISFREVENRYPIVSPTIIDDSTIMSSLYVFPKEPGPLTAHLGTMNLDNGNVELLDTATAIDGGRFGVTVSKADSLVVLAYFNKDLIRLYKPSGRLIRNIYGPDYSDAPDSRMRFFSGIFIDRNIYCFYSGKDAKENIGSCSIIVLGLDGTYIKTLRLPSQVFGIAYHKGKRRIYVSTDDESQFGYIQL